MALRPIPGALPGSENLPFPTGPSKGPTIAAPEPPKRKPAEARSQNTARAGDWEFVVLRSRRGYGASSEIVTRKYPDGDLMIGDYLVIAPAAQAIVRIMRDGRGEYEYVVSEHVKIKASWFDFDDSRPGFALLIHDGGPGGVTQSVSMTQPAARQAATKLMGEK